MRKIKTILRLTSLGLALYYTVSMIAHKGIMDLCQWVYPYVERGVVTRAIFGGLVNIDSVTIRIMVVVIIIAIVGDHGKFFQFLFDVIIGWAVMMLWRLLAIQVPELFQGMFCDVTLSIFMTAVAVVLIEAKVTFARKDKKDKPVVVEEPVEDNGDEENENDV